MIHKYKVGEIVILPADDLNDYPQCRAKVTKLTPRGYELLELAETSQPNFSDADTFYVDFDLNFITEW